MSNSISDKLSVLIEANPSSFVTGVGQSLQALQKFQASFSPVVSSLNNLNRAMSGVNLSGFVGRFTSLLAPLQTAALDVAIGNYGGAITSAAQFASSLADVGSAAIIAAGNQAKFAQILGITNDAMVTFSGLGRRAGLDTQEVADILTKAFIPLGEFRQAMVEGNFENGVVRAIRRLGLDAEALARLHPEEMFWAIADALKAASSESRLFETAQIFGRRNAAALAPIIGGGSANAQRVGATSFLSAEDLDRANEFRKVMKELNATTEEIFNAFAFNVGQALLPTMKDFAKWFEEHGAEIREFFKDLGESARLAGETIRDAKNVASTAFPVIRDAAIRMLPGGLPADIIRSIVSFSLSTSQIGDAPRRIKKQSPTGVDESDRLVAERTQNAQQALDTWMRQAEAIGRTSRELEIFRAQQGGVAQSTIDAMKHFDAWVTQFERVGQAAMAIKKSLEAGIGPLDRFSQRFADLGRSVKAGLLSVSQAGVGQAQAFLDLEKSVGIRPNQFAGAVTQGSTEAFSASLASRADQTFAQKTPDERVREVLERARVIQANQLTQLELIAAALQRNRGIVPARDTE